MTENEKRCPSKMQSFSENPICFKKWEKRFLKLRHTRFISSYLTTKNNKCLTHKNSSPEQHHISCDRKISLRVNNNNSVLCKGKICMTFPTIFVVSFVFVLPEVIMGWDCDASNEFAVSSVPYHNFILISSTQEITINICNEKKIYLLSY